MSSAEYWSDHIPRPVYRLLYSTLCFPFSCILNQIINFPKPTSYILLSQTHYELHKNYKGKQIYFWVGKNIFDEKEIVTSEKRNSLFHK